MRGMVQNNFGDEDPGLSSPGWGLKIHSHGHMVKRFPSNGWLFDVILAKGVKKKGNIMIHDRWL